MANFYGNNSDNQIYAPAGAGDSNFYGYAGNDAIYGGNGNDVIWGGSGNDELKGAGGDDLLYGGSGHDILNGGTGTDTMYGGAGDDTYYIDSLADQVIEYSSLGGYEDTVYSTVSTSPKWLPDHIENLTLLGSAKYGDGNDLSNVIKGTNNDNILIGDNGNDRLYGNGGNDYLHGDNHADLLWGGDGNDILYGGSGSDYLSGGNGHDVLYGDDGFDSLHGGNGKDTLTGGGGKDIFRFSFVEESPANTNKDTITDFKWWEEDKIDISAIDANLFIEGNQPFEPSQLSYDVDTEIFSADVLGGADLGIQLIGASGFDPALDVIVDSVPLT